MSTGVGRCRMNKTGSESRVAWAVRKQPVSPRTLPGNSSLNVPIGPEADGFGGVFSAPGYPNQAEAQGHDVHLFDVDHTIIDSDNRLRADVTELFQRLRAEGHTLYLWSGIGPR